MRFNKLDLNLLVALDALLKERSITRAAEQLHLSPSAMSNALARLRDYFDDDLLVQVGRQMQPTSRAEDLHDAVRDVLVRIESTVAVQPAFVPANSDRVFRIFASDYTQMVFGPELMRRAAEARFAGSIQFLPQVGRPDRELERGEADRLIMPSFHISTDHPCEVLYREHFDCVLWKDARLAQGELTRERYVAARHVVMEPARLPGISFESAALQRLGVERRHAATSYTFATLASLVCGTEYVATVHRRLAAQLQRAWPLVIRPLPVPIEPMSQAMQWHEYRTKDPGMQWLRRLARDAADALQGADGTE